MHGAKAHRLLYLFQKMLIIAKRKEDGNLLVKGSIKVIIVSTGDYFGLGFDTLPLQHVERFSTLTLSLGKLHQLGRRMVDNGNERVVNF